MTRLDGSNAARAYLKLVLLLLSITKVAEFLNLLMLLQKWTRR